MQNIGWWVVSIWHDRWQYLSRRSSQHPVCPNLLSGCLAMSSLVFRPSSCHLLVSILRPDGLVWLSGVAECDQRIVFFWLLLCRVVPFVQIVPSLRHLWCGRANWTELNSNEMNWPMDFSLVHFVSFMSLRTRLKRPSASIYYCWYAPWSTILLHLIYIHIRARAFRAKGRSFIWPQHSI